MMISEENQFDRYRKRFWEKQNPVITNQMVMYGKWSRYVRQLAQNKSPRVLEAGRLDTRSTSTVNPGGRQIEWPRRSEEIDVVMTQVFDSEAGRRHDRQKSNTA